MEKGYRKVFRHNKHFFCSMYAPKRYHVLKQLKKKYFRGGEKNFDLWDRAGDALECRDFKWIIYKPN